MGFLWTYLKKQAPYEKSSQGAHPGVARHDATPAGRRCAVARDCGEASLVSDWCFGSFLPEKWLSFWLILEDLCWFYHVFQKNGWVLDDFGRFSRQNGWFKNHEQFVWNSPREKHKKKEVMTERSLMVFECAFDSFLILQKSAPRQLTKPRFVRSDMGNDRPLTAVLSPKSCERVSGYSWTCSKETHCDISPTKLFKVRWNSSNYAPSEVTEVT